jgi:hypothetical protein
MRINKRQGGLRMKYTGSFFTRLSSGQRFCSVQTVFIDEQHFTMDTTSGKNAVPQAARGAAAGRPPGHTRRTVRSVTTTPRMATQAKKCKPGCLWTGNGKRPGRRELNANSGSWWTPARHQLPTFTSTFRQDGFAAA